MCLGGGRGVSPLCQLAERRAEEACPFSSQLVAVLDVGAGEFNGIEVGHAARLVGAAEVVQETHQVILHPAKLVVLALWRGGAGCRRGRGRVLQAPECISTEHLMIVVQTNGDMMQWSVLTSTEQLHDVPD